MMMNINYKKQKKSENSALSLIYFLHLFFNLFGMSFYHTNIIQSLKFMRRFRLHNVLFWVVTQFSVGSVSEG
jgi:hypothetical protein